MSLRFTHDSLEDILGRFIESWKSGVVPSDLYTDNARLHSSHIGAAVGAENLTAHLRSGVSDGTSWQVEYSNAVSRAQGASAVVTAYLHGDVTPSSTTSPAVSFGGVLVLHIEHALEGAQIDSVRIQIRWTQGRTTLLSGWTLPVMDRQWQPGDATPVLLSELDAAWRQIPKSDLELSEKQAIAEVWTRYAWALDQADYGLFDGAFDEDVESELTPMGRMHGKRTLLSTLKEFRMPWPWMMHYGAPIRIEIAADRKSATMVLGRIMPGQTRSPDGAKIFGAHYAIRLRKDPVAGWRMNQMDYVPGWIREPSAPQA